MTHIKPQIKYILMDIEGTTTSIDFVHKSLFPFSYQRMESFVTENLHNPEVEKALAQVGETYFHETGKQPTAEESIVILREWITADRKHGALKTLQGFIWQQGYEAGQIKGHVYADVLTALQEWKSMNLGLGIYSSGSVLAQKLIFGYSVSGDLTPYISNYFDTEVGMKRDPQSYVTISKKLNLNPSSILFLSDIPQELEAAQESGIEVQQILREGQVGDERFPNAKSFLEI